MLGPILPAWVRSIARLWPNSQTLKNDGDGTVTFIAGPPHEFLRILSQQENGETQRPTGMRQQGQTAIPAGREGTQIASGTTRNR
jgi:hypothetical protein